ncbi:N-acetyltransferase family protein [Roseivivax sp. GX 12232]|uniref:GNAT family N-acetyltransferase n=1 Tax=Roseivivax sp. GX 12232 TaxID=2900547 RepID=UPI00351DA723
MAELTLRPARAGDAEAIAAIWNPFVRDSTITFTTEEKTPEAVAHMIEERGRAFLVAEAANGLSGFATYGAFRGGPGYARTQEHSVFTAPGTAGQGLGRALVQALEAEARQAGHHSLIGGISAENTGALAFHARLGFAEVGRIREAGRKFDRWIDLVLVQKMLFPAA